MPRLLLARLAAALALTACAAAVTFAVATVSPDPKPPERRAARPLPRRAPPPPPTNPPRPKPHPPSIRWRDSRALGTPSAGSLVRGVRLPAATAHFRTWDPILRRSPNRPWRRHGTDDLVRTVLRVARLYAAAEPAALQMLIGDMSRARGGDFGQRYGIVGHSSHQNGRDVDVYYPRRDRRPVVPRTPAQVDLRLAHRLVDLFVAAGAQTVLVGPSLALKRTPGVVKPYPNHDNHLHVRIAGA